MRVTKFLFFVFFPDAQAVQVQKTVENLQKELNEWKKRSSDTSAVDTAISTSQLLIAKPAGVFDLFAAMSALEDVLDVAIQKGVDRANRFAIICASADPS